MGFNYLKTNKDIAPQFKITNAASWIEERVFIKPNGVTELTFTDFNPNMFMLQNNTNIELKISMSNYPTPDNYDRLITPHTMRNFGQPKPINILYFLNESNTSGYIKLWRLYDEFDLEINQSTDVTLPDIYIEGQGVVKGFGTGVSLPSGNNKIGSVDVANIPTDYAKEANQKDYTTTIENILSTLQNIGNSETVPTTITTFELTNITNETVLSSGGKINIEMLTNDGENPFSLIIKGAEDSTEHAITIKAGETLEDLKLNVSYAKVNAITSNSYSMRAMVSHD